eukprot:scaffold64110_cov59-Attheya_sp.AAC.1
MVGRFKTETREKVFYQPLAVATKSGIENGVWIKRTIDAYAKLGITTGPFFCVKKKGGGVQRCKPSDLDPDFHSILLRVQARYPQIIPSSVNVVEEYRIRRSLRRGSTTHAGNMAVPKEVIEANNRWRKHGNSRGVLPGMSMVERYSDAKAMQIPSVSKSVSSELCPFPTCTMVWTMVASLSARRTRSPLMSSARSR